MTIAVGIRCKNGVVLCTDTQITEESGKSYESKIFSINPDADAYLAYAGSTEFVKELVAELRSITKDKLGGELVKEVKAAYRRFHNKYYTQAPKAERDFAYLILAVRENDHMELYSACGRHFHPVEGYVSFGAGRSVVEPFLGSLRSETLQTHQGARMAIYALWRIKDFAPSCGGKTRVLSAVDWNEFDESCTREWSIEDVKSVEDSYAYLEEQLRPLMLSFADMYPKELPKVCRKIGAELKKHRAAQMRYELYVRESEDNLGG